MPLVCYVPSRITEFIDVTMPDAGDDGTALTYDHATGIFEYVAFEAAGAVAAHAGASDPHAGYLLASGTKDGTGTQNLVGVRLADGSDSVPSVSFSSDTDTGFYRSASNTISIAIGGIAKFAFDDTTNISPRLRIANRTANQFSTTGFILENTEASDADGQTEWHVYAAKLASGSDTGNTSLQIRLRNATQSEAATYIDIRDGNILLQQGFTAGSMVQGYVGVSVATPTALLHLAAPNSSRASFRMAPGPDPASPNSGDIWHQTAGRLQFRRSSTTETIASGVTAAGGAATAGATWAATEQAMLQAVYDAARSFALLT